MDSKIVLFTDVHYGVTLENKRGKRGVNTFGDVKENLLILKKRILEIDPIFSICLGDVMTTKTRIDAIKKYIDFINIFKSINIKCLVGNHEPFFLTDLEIFKINNSSKKFYLEKDGILHIFINSNIIDGEYVFENDLFDWLEDIVFRKDVTSIIYSHFPISGELANISYYHTGRPEACFLKNSEKFRTFLIDSNVKAFISGHTHFYFEKKINGIKHITIPSFSEEKNGVSSCEFGVLNLKTLDLEIKKI